MTEPCPHSEPDAAHPASRTSSRLAAAVPIVLVLAALVAFFLPNTVGGVIFAVIAGAILVMTLIAWRQLTPSARAGRCALFLLLAAAALVHLLPRSS